MLCSYVFANTNHNAAFHFQHRANTFQNASILIHHCTCLHIRILYKIPCFSSSAKFRFQHDAASILPNERCEFQNVEHEQCHFQNVATKKWCKNKDAVSPLQRAGPDLKSQNKSHTGKSETEVTGFNVGVLKGAQQESCQWKTSGTGR